MRAALTGRQSRLKQAIESLTDFIEGRYRLHRDALIADLRGEFKPARGQHRMT